MYFVHLAIALELVLSQKPMFGDSKVFNVMCTLNNYLLIHIYMQM